MKYCKLPTYALLSLTCLEASASSTVADSLFSMSLEELSRIQVLNSATGFVQKVDDAPASVTIINAEEWQAKGATTLIQALRGSVGIQIDTTRLGNSHNKIAMRGLSGTFGEQVKVLIDGVPLNRMHSGSITAIPELSLVNYKRIEIIRSPGSVVYGADAFAGVVNLISYEFAEQPENLTVTAGTFDTYQLSAIGKLKLNDWSIQFSADYQAYGDDKNRIVEEDLQSTFDELFGTRVSRAPGKLNNSYEQLTFNTKLSHDNLSISYFAHTGNFGFGVGVAQALDPDNLGTQDVQNLRLDYDLSELVNGQLELSAWYLYQYSHFPFVIFPEGAQLPLNSSGNLAFTDVTTVATFTDGFIGQPGNYSNQYHLNLSHVFSFGNQHKLRWQIGAEKQFYNPFEYKNFGPTVLDGTETVVDGQLTDVTNSPYLYANKDQRSYIFLSLQDEWHINRTTTLNTGIRYDRYSDFGATFNPRISLKWQYSNTLDIRLFAGSAFRAPSFIDLNAKNNPAATGNKNLKPEQIRTYELSLSWQPTDSFHSESTLFHYRAKKLINFIPQPLSNIALAKNNGNLNATGIELMMQWRPTKNLDIKANYTHLTSEDKLANSTPDIANSLAALTINWQVLPQFTINLSNNWVMDRLRSAEDMRSPLKKYLWASLKANYHLSEQSADISLTINNINDSQSAILASPTSVPYGLPMAGRQILISYNKNF